MKNTVGFSFKTCMFLKLPIMVLWDLPLWMIHEKHCGFSKNNQVFFNFPIVGFNMLNMDVY